MRIFYLGINYWPEQTGIGAFSTYRAEYLATRGHDVTVCTAVPYYPQWRVPDLYRRRPWRREVVNGVTVLRNWLYVPQRVTAARRMLHESSFLASSLARGLIQMRPPDVLFAVSPPLGLAVPAIVLSRLWRVPYIFDVEDMQPDAAVELGMLRNPQLLRFLYGLEGLAYRKAALVTTLTEGMRRRIIAKGVENVMLIPPRADESLFSIRGEQGTAFRERHGLTGKFVVSHSGNMGVKQGLDILLECAARCADPNVVFLLVGSGAMCASLREKAERMRLASVRFLPLLERAEFEQMLAASDICLITQQRTVSDIVFPSKTVTYLSAGRAVVASVNRTSEVARAIEASGAGRVVPPEDAGTLLAAILELRARPDLAVMSERARRYAAETWSAERVLGGFERRLQTLVDRPLPAGPAPISIPPVIPRS